MHSLRYHEKKRHGTAEFPAEYYPINEAHPQYVMPFHWHKEWELIRVRRGTFPIHADEQVIVARAGDVVLIRDSMLHGGVPEDCDYECFVFDLHGLFRSSELIKKHLRPFYRLKQLPRIYYPGDEYPAIGFLAAEIMNACPGNGREAYDELSLLAGLCRLFACIEQGKLYEFNPERAPHKSQRIEQIKVVLEHIEKEYASPLSLEKLAQIAGMNPNYFCRMFKEIIQTTPIEYLLQYRIEQAAMRLTTADISVTEAAMACGFNDYSYFIRVFKRVKGVTPKQYQLHHMGSHEKKA